MNNSVFTFRKVTLTTSCVTGMVANDETSIIIPEYDDSGFKVTSIDTNAFKGNTNIQEVIIPDSIISVGKSAFENCANLTRLVLPAKMESILDHAFKHCDITYLNVPELSELGFGAFSYNIHGLFVVKEKIKYVKSHAFNKCDKLICLLAKKELKKWDAEWNGGIENFSTNPQDIPIFNESNSIETKNKNISDLYKNDNLIEDTEINSIKNSNSIVYAKNVKLSFPAIQLVIHNIPVLQHEQLSFYQKFVILLLQKGIKANNLEELTKIISNILNVKCAFIEDFINFLVKKSYIQYDEINNKFLLSKGLNFVIKEEYNNAMFTETASKKTDCNKIIYIKGMKKFYLEEDFNNGVFIRKGNALEQNSIMDKSIFKEIAPNADLIKELLNRYFNSTNMHLDSNFNFNDCSLNTTFYNLEFDALLQYSYDKEQKKSTLFNTIVLNDNFLTKDYIDTLVKPYMVDTKLPRFLGMQDKFYNQVSESIKNIDKYELSIADAMEEVKPLEEEFNNSKKMLNDLKKDYKDKINEANNTIKKLNEQLESMNKEILSTRNSINGSKSYDNSKINDLKKKSKEIKASQNKLETELSNKVIELGKLETTLKDTEKTQLKAIEDKFKELDEARKAVANIEVDYQHHEANLLELLKDNDNKINPTIASVIKKYPAKENIFNRYVTDIAIWLDRAISASECNSFGEIARCIDIIREMYRKVIQIVFDTLLGKNENSLGAYLNDLYKQVTLERLFKSRGVNISIKNRIVTFHEVANAIGHLAENGPKKEANEKKLTEFKKLTLNDRNKILLSIPEFFNSITFKNSEIKTFISKLTIK